jgi:hypothetical protein
MRWSEDVSDLSLASQRRASTASSTSVPGSLPVASASARSRSSVAGGSVIVIVMGQQNRQNLSEDASAAYHTWPAPRKSQIPTHPPRAAYINPPHASRPAALGVPMGVHRDEIEKTGEKVNEMAYVHPIDRRDNVLHDREPAKWRQTS